MKKGFIKNIKTYSQKVANIILVIGILFTSMGFPSVVRANTNTKLIINSMSGANIIEIGGENQYLDFSIGENHAGSVTVKYSGTDTIISPASSANGWVYDFGDVQNKNLEVTISSEDGFSAPSYRINSGENQSIVNNKITLNLTGGTTTNLYLQYQFNNPFPPQSTPSGATNPSIKIATPRDYTAYLNATDGDQDAVYYKKDNKIIAVLKLKVGEKYIAPTIVEGKAKFDLTAFNSAYIANIEFVELARGNSLEMFYHIDGAEQSVQPNNKLMVNITGNQEYRVDFDIVPTIYNYPLVSYFKTGDEEPVAVNMDEEKISVPDDFEEGTITVKAKIRTLEDGYIIPDDGTTTEGVASEMTIHPLIANLDELNDTVEGGKDIDTITVHKGFRNYGRINVHFVPENLQMNTFVNFATKEAIVIAAQPVIPLSGSLGTANIDQALVTTANGGNISIFFGNTDTLLYAMGDNVEGITAVTGNITTSIDENGGAMIELPSLAEETTIPIVVTIKLKDGTSIKKNINIVRTAIQLYHTSADGKSNVYAGYVMNKGYLYNNHDHDDSIFDAYFQVVLYKDNMVVGYKQIKIDDEKIINDLGDNMTGTIEIRGKQEIPIYDKDTDKEEYGDVDKVSVFLTNGPIKFDSDTLPSVEFGIGSGVTLEWEE